MATFTKTPLSGAANGLAIKVAATTSPGTTIHTAVTGTSSWDEVWLWAYNSSTSSVLLTVQWGGTATPDNDIKLTLAGQGGLVAVVPGLILQNGLLIRAYAGTTNVVTVSGFVNRIV